MLRLLVRFVSVLFLASGLVALIVDGTRSLAGGSLYVTTLASALQALKPLALEELQTTFGVHFAAAFAYALMLVPVSLALCGVGALLFVISHKPRATIGYLPE